MIKDALPLFQRFIVASFVYVCVCFLLSVAVYQVVVFTGFVSVYDHAGNAVDAIIPPTTVIVSSLFVGNITALVCSGGLLGLFLVVHDLRSDYSRAMVAGALLALICSLIFMTGTTFGNDHLVARGLLVTVISLLVGLLPRGNWVTQTGSQI